MRVNTVPAKSRYPVTMTCYNQRGKIAMMLLQIIKDLAREALPEAKFKTVKILSPRLSGCSRGDRGKVSSSLSFQLVMKGSSHLRAGVSGEGSTERTLRCPLSSWLQAWLQPSWGERSLPSLPEATVLKDNYHSVSSGG